MNIKPEQLQNHLSNQPASLYFAFGSEILLVEQSLTTIKDAAKKLGFNERFRFDIDGNFSWDAIFNLISSPSLFADKRIIECRLTTGKIGVKGSKALSELTENLPDDIMLIISSGKLDMAQQKSKWFKALDKKGVIIQHWEVQSEQLVGWIVNHMSQLGLSSIDTILNNHRVWQKRKPLISFALKTHSYQQLQKLLLALGRIDRSLKGMDNLNVYDELQAVVITLSGKNSGLNS
jgi:DNA polymerase-3 subunit delta